MLKKDLVGRITADFALTQQSFLRLLTAALFAWLILQFAASARKAQTLLYIFIISALIYGTYGLWAVTQGSETILWMGERQMSSGLSATFVNRNSAATYFGLAGLTSIVLMLQAYREIFIHQRSDRSLADWFIDLLASRVGLLALASILFLGCLLLTHSRAGILSTGIALAFAIILQTLLSSRSRSNQTSSSHSIRRFFLLLFAWLAIGAYIALQISGDGFMDRLSNYGNSNHDRWNVYRLCLEMLQDFPLTGIGLGAFQTAFIFYIDETLPNNIFWDKAHNSYFEVLLGMGIPMGMLFLSSFLWAITRCTKAFLYRQKNRYFSILGLSSSLLVGLHALVDFSIEIQAITLAYCLILAIAVAQSWSSRRRQN